MEHFFTLTAPAITIRSKYYVSVLLQRLEVANVARIPAALSELSGRERESLYLKYRSDFFRYWNGQNIRNERLVSDVDELLPGTARILCHPLWQLISGRATLEPELIFLARMVEPALQGFIYSHDPASQAGTLKNYSMDHRWLKKGAEFLRMIDRRGLDELTALLLIIRAHELQGACVVSYLLRRIVDDFFFEISRLETFKPIAILLYKQIHEALTKPVCNGEKYYCRKLNCMSESESAFDFTLREVEANTSSCTSRDNQYSRILRCNRGA